MVCMAKELLHCRTSVLARVYAHFCGERGVYPTGDLAPVHADVFIPQVLLTSPYISVTQSLQGVHMRSCVRSLFIHVGEREWGCSTSLYRTLVAWRGGVFSKEGEQEVLSCVFLFLTQVGVYVSARHSVCTRTHTHTLHVGRSMWAQESGRDNWRAQRIQMDRISANMYVYMCTKYTCVYICCETG